MPVNKRKIRLSALSSIVCLQAGPPWLTLRERRICPLNALDRLEIQSGFRHLSACSAGKSAAQDGVNQWVLTLTTRSNNKGNRHGT